MKIVHVMPGYVPVAILEETIKGRIDTLMKKILEIMSVDKLYQRYYLDKLGWIDGTTQFKRMIETRLSPEYEILDIGAGKRGDYKHGS